MSNGSVHTRPSARRRAGLVVAAAATGVLMFAGCSPTTQTASTGTSTGGPAAVEGTVEIAFLPLAQANPYVQATLEGIEAAAAADGDANVTTFDGGLDATKQSQQCQDAVTSGRYHAIISIPVTPTNLVPCYEQAIARGIRVANTDFPIGPDASSGDPQVEGTVASILDPSTIRGEWIFEMIDAACGDAPCKVALITGVLADPYSAAVNDVVTELAAEAGTIEIVAVREGFYLPNTTLPVVQDLLQATPDLDVIATTSDPMTVGAQEALEKAGISGVELVGGGYSTAAPEAIASGDWVGTFLSLPFDEGELAATYVLRNARGEDVSGIGQSAVVESGLPAVIFEDDLADLAGLEPQWQGL